MSNQLDTEAMKELQQRYSELGTWTGVAESLGENAGYLWRVANGKRSCSFRLYRKLFDVVSDEQVNWRAKGAWLPDWMITGITALGDGNFSRGVRRLYRMHRTEMEK